MALTADVGINARAAQVGAKDLERAFDLVGDSLDGIARDGDRAADQLETNFRDMVRDAKRAADDTADAWKRSARESSAAADDFKRDAGQNVAGFKDEAKQNFAEVAASFDGSVQGMADGVQGLTGGLATALTPGIGIPVAILGAAAAAFFTSWQQAAADSETRVEEMYQGMIDKGAGFLDAKFIADKITELAGSQDTYNQAADRGKQLGVETQDVLRAMAGDQGAINLLLDIAQAKRDQEKSKIEGSGRSIEDQAVLLDALNTKHGETTDWLRQIQDEHGTAADRARDARDAIQQGNDKLREMRDSVRDWKLPKVSLDLDTSSFDQALSNARWRASQGITTAWKIKQVPV